MGFGAGLRERLQGLRLRKLHWGKWKLRWGTWLRSANWGGAVLLGAAGWLLADRAGHIAGRISFFASHFQGIAIDGAFQVLNPLRRLADGQVPGVDFQFFHGLGTLMVHYPLFALAGGDLAASELARETMAPVLFGVSALAVIWVATRRLTMALAGTAVLLLFFPLLMILMLPAGSLLGVRSTVPLLVGAAIMVLYRLEPGRRRTMAKAAVLGLLALAFFMSVEHGIAAIAAYVVVGVVLGRDKWTTRLAGLVWDGAIVAVLVLAIFTLVSREHFPQPLLFALRDVPADQFWYFGAPPNEVILSLLGVLLNAKLVFWWTAAALLLVGLARLRMPALEPQRLGFGFLLVYGLVVTFAIFGIENDAYFQPLIRAVLLTLIGFGYLLWWPRLKDRRAQTVVAGGAGVALLVAHLTVPIPPEINRMPHITRALPEASGMKLSPAWDKHMEAIRATVPQEATLWSTYASLAEAERGSFGPLGYDYIIHALGPERRREYTRELGRQRPDYVSTVRLTYSRYEEWLRMSHWQWYERMLLNYHYRAWTSFSLIWERNNEEWKDPDDLGWIEEVRLPENNLRLTKLPEGLPDGSLVTVQVDYRAENKLDWVPLFGKMARYFVAGYDSANTMPTSLPPYEQRWEFPVVTKEGEVPRLYFYTGEPVPGARLEVTAVRYRVLQVDEAARWALADGPRFARLIPNEFAEDPR